MKMSYIQAACAATVLFLWPGPQAQAQDANRDVVISKTDVRDIVHRLDRRTDEFKENFDRAVEHSSMEGTKGEDRAEDRANKLHDEASKLKDVFNDKKDKNHREVRERVDRTLAVAAEMDRVMARHRFTDKLQRDWDLLRSDLNALAAVYGLSSL
jgi:hypothetical protein